MADAPIQLTVAAFQDENAAGEALKQLRELKKTKLIGLVDAAVIRKDEDGKIRIKETGDMSGKKGAGIGVLIGGAVGLLAGPIGLWAGGGAIAGWLAARRDKGFRNERLEKIGEALQPGTSAIIAVVEHKWVSELENELAEAGADVTTEILADTIAEQLKEGGELAVTAVVGEEGAAVEAVATDTGDRS